MARSDIPTYGLLNEWPRLMSEDAFRFNQILGQGVEQAACPVYIQQDRDDIARSIADALDMAAGMFKYYPRPVWFPLDEPGNLGDGTDASGYETIELGSGWPLSNQELQTRWGYLQAFGTRATTLIEADVDVQYVTQPGTGNNNLVRATLTVTSDVDAREIQVFFRTADGAESAANALWQIEPLKVSKSGNTVTITGTRALFVNPVNVWDIPYNEPNYNTIHAGNLSNAADFVTKVDVYRVYNDTSDACRLVYWDTCNETEGYISMTPRIVDRRLGLFEAKLPQGTCIPYGAYPTAVNVRYYAGYPLQGTFTSTVANAHIDASLAEKYINYANTMQAAEQGLCSYCDRVNSRYAHNRERADLTKTNVNLSNMFGFMVGQVLMADYVWKRALGRGGRL